MIYLLIKALHVTSVLLFVSGLMPLAVAGVSNQANFGHQLRKWDRYMTTPALAMTWLTGLAMAVRGDWFGAKWLTLKLVLVFGLSLLHGVLAGQVRRKLHGGETHTELPTRSAASLLIAASAAIAFLVVTKPFS